MRWLAPLAVLCLIACSDDSGPVFQEVSAGYYHVCARMAGRVKCWGHNEFGQLGLGTTENMGDEPGEITRLPYVNLGTRERVLQVSSGGYHTCALFSSGRVKCWGLGYEGATGQNDFQDIGGKPEHMGARLKWVDLGTDVRAVQISSGAAHTCAITRDQRLKCWGQNFFGQLGLGDRRNRGVHENQMGDALPYVDVGDRLLEVRAGDGHTCAILVSHRVKCWGNNGFGQLGLGTVEHEGDEPGEMGAALPYVELAGPVVEIVAHYEHTCALLVGGTVQCWGDNKYGQLGLGDSLNRGDEPDEMGANLPTVNFDSGARVLQIDLGYGYTCALLENLRMKCVGYNSDGRMGYDFEGSWTEYGGVWGWHPLDMGANLPFVDLGPIGGDESNEVISFTTGDSHTCAIMIYDKVKCWGYAGFGEIGSEDTIDHGRVPGTMGINLPVLRL